MQCLPRRKERVGTPRIRARLTIVKLLVPPVIFHPSLKRLEQYESSIAQPMSREVTFFNDFVVFHWFKSNLWYITCIYYTDLHSKLEQMPGTRKKVTSRN